MSRIGTKILTFSKPDPLPEDLVGFNLRIVPDGTTLDYSVAPIDLGNPEVDTATGKVRIDLSTIEAVQALNLDGVYDLGVTTRDDNAPVPNESDFLPIDDVTFDFTAPAAPTDGSVE